MTPQAQLAYISQQPYFYQWLTNLTNYLHCPSYNHFSYNSLIDSFHWDKTPEGDSFWSEIHDSFSFFKDRLDEADLFALIEPYRPIYPELFI